MIIEKLIVLAASMTFVVGFLTLILKDQYGESHIAYNTGGRLFVTGMITVTGLIIYWSTV